MTVDDVVKLIEACKNGPVTKLKFEKLEVHFNHEPRPVIRESPEETPQVPQNREVEQTLIQDIIEEIETQALLASDPLAFEAEMMRDQDDETPVYRRPKRYGFEG
jgi:hypothetical protein